MTLYRLCLVGFGNVGQAFARLLLEKQVELQQKHDIQFIVTGIATGRHGKAINPTGLNLEQALACISAHQSLQSLSIVTPPETMSDFIKTCPADVMFENSPVNHHTGQPAVEHVRSALEANMHCVTANKGTVVHGYRQLTALAASHGKRFMVESTVMDGAPIFSLFRSALPAVKLTGFKGILNSTTNLILGRMETGESLEDAISYTQSVGLAETDPSADVDGWDAAIKVAALATVLMDYPLTPEQVNPQGIRSITPQKMAEALAAGERWKLVCRASLVNGELQTRVAPERVSPASVLYAIGGSSSYCEFQLDTLPGLGITESDPSPVTTAYGLLADFINLTRGM
jgi:homoserine dehydrogenase